MGHAYYDIAFTEPVRDEQRVNGSRGMYAAAEDDADRGGPLSAREADFIRERDGFYQATVSETGWPYVQFRGGPPGFLKVLDAHTLAYADLRGNRQYISVGNLRGNDKVALILMDYARRRRLKLMGRVRLVSPADEPALLAQLQPLERGATVERAVVIHVEGFDWNCPQHITPRFTQAEVERAVEPLQRELAQLRAQVAALSTQEPRP